MTNEKENGEFGAFLSGLLIGGLVGAAVALLLAPQTGEETRMLIKDKSIELKDKTTETAGTLAQQAKGKATEIQQRGQVILEEQKTRFTKKDQGEVDVTVEEITDTEVIEEEETEESSAEA